MISESTTAAAGRFLAAYPLLTLDERTRLLASLLEVAFAEGAQYLALKVASRKRRSIPGADFWERTAVECARL